MLKILSYFTLVLILTASCGEERSETPSENLVEKGEKQPLEAIIERHIEAKLDIPSTEKYTYQIYKEHLDGDDKLDAIITVNRLSFALEEAAQSGNSAKRAEIGFTGNYNYYFFYDGGLDLVSPAILVPSSPQAELTVKFENVISAAYKDVVIDFRIMDACYRNIYTVINHSPVRIFQWNIFENLGKENVSSVFIEYAPGTTSLSKDILLYEGKLENASEGKNDYHLKPVISKTTKLLHRFFYLEKETKYFTKK